MTTENEKDNVEVFIDRNIFRQSLNIYLTKRTPEGNFVGKLEWKKVENPTCLSKSDGEPTLIVDDEPRSGEGPRPRFLYSLMQSLEWVGVLKKQPEVVALEGQLGAMNNHLQDMQKLVFKEKVSQ